VSAAPPARLTAVVSDFGGVLTIPLLDAFERVSADVGVPSSAVEAAMAALARRDGEPPLYRLERGECTEAEFVAALEAEVSRQAGKPVSLDGYGRRFMDALEPNAVLFEHYRELRDRGVRMALLTNNVREWEPMWRAKLPVDELFELVVDSAFVGLRKPDPRIFALTLERFGVPAKECVFVDDLEVNVRAAAEAGMHPVHFRDTDQAIAELGALFGLP
jgi:epoxide hydrolase-like predicted phosphatase